MCKVADHENHVRWIYLTTVLCMEEGQKYARMDDATRYTHAVKWNISLKNNPENLHTS